MDKFDEAESEVVQATEEEKSEEIRYTRKKPKREPLPKHLPREEVIHDIPEEEKVCSCCQGALHKMGEERSEQLEFVPLALGTLP